MGCFGSKQKLTKEDLDFLKSHTRYDEATIKEWYKGFRVRNYLFISLSFTQIVHFNAKQMERGVLDMYFIDRLCYSTAIKDIRVSSFYISVAALSLRYIAMSSNSPDCDAC